MIMKKIINVLVVLSALLYVSCTDSENNPSINPQSDRICFVDKNAFEAYLASNTPATSGYFSSDVANPTSVIEHLRHIQPLVNC